MAEIDVYKTGLGSNVCKIHISNKNNEKNDKSLFETLSEALFGKKQESKTFSNSGVETIIVLDVSGSMSSYIKKIITHYIPNTLDKLGYGDQKITLVTFSDNAKVYKMNSMDFRMSKIQSEGGTRMFGSIAHLRSIITSSPCKKIRILTITDGDIVDQLETLNSATELAKYVKDNYSIHSSAIRLFTSSQQPDTRAMTGMLQLNNIGDSKLLDFRCTSNDNDFVDIFSTGLLDNLGTNISLTSSTPIFMTDPWKTPTSSINLFEGDNTFWISSTDDLSIELTYNDKNIGSVVINKKEQLDFNSFETVLKEKIDFYIKRLKVLKVLDMGDSKDEINEIVKYFSQLEKIFAMNDKSEVDLSIDTSIKSRVKFLKKYAFRQSKSIVQVLSSIANQDKVSQLNSAQQASYLKSTTASSNAINLAKIAMKQGFDFDEKSIKEVKDMKLHLDELKDIDDSDHARSFYSMETTLGGIKELCSLDDETLNNLGALEILQVLNIVGLPCQAVVGDFPDPKTYHITDLMLGTCISISDIMSSKQVGNDIIEPYSKKKIINSIPFYDDDRIQQFLMKYAPNLLEYTAGLGMRGIIANVPNTYKYTIVDGLWWMIRELQDNQIEVNAKLFVKYVHTYNTAVDTLFDYVPNLIKEMSDEDKKNNLSIYLANNGITNMLGPLIRIQSDPEKMKFIPEILRALYTFEYYQVLRKFYRSDSDGYIKRKQMLDDLVGIDYSKYSAKLPELFESQKVPEMHGEYHINRTIYNDVNKRIYWLDYLCLAPKMISLALKNDVNSLMKLKSFKGNNTVLEKELDISYGMEKFKLFCMYQGLMYDTLAARYDEAISKMKIEDSKREDIVDYIMSEYIKKQYYSNYQSELAKQGKIEIEVLTKTLVDSLVAVGSLDEFKNLLSNGINKNHVSVAISDTYKPGFEELKAKIFDPSVACPERSSKVRVLVMGQDNGTIVYNKGNTLRMPLPNLEQLYKNAGLINDWYYIKSDYVEKSIHLYRSTDKPNRHTHCNPKPSYWAYGYKNLGSYFATISKAEQDEYCKVHTNCCGIWDGKPYKMA